MGSLFGTSLVVSVCKLHKDDEKSSIDQHKKTITEILQPKSLDSRSDSDRKIVLALHLKISQIENQFVSENPLLVTWKNVYRKVQGQETYRVQHLDESQNIHDVAQLYKFHGDSSSSSIPCALEKFFFYF